MIKINHSNIICYSMKVINDPEKDQDVCNKKYLDNEIKKRFTGPLDLNMHSRRITNLADPVLGTDAINKNFFLQELFSPRALQQIHQQSQSRRQPD